MNVLITRLCGQLNRSILNRSKLFDPLLRYETLNITGYQGRIYNFLEGGGGGGFSKNFFENLSTFFRSIKLIFRALPLARFSSLWPNFLRCRQNLKKKSPKKAF